LAILNGFFIIKPTHLKDFAIMLLTVIIPMCALPQTLCRLLNAIVNRTATLMAQWQLVGFAHGVMNTDNFRLQAAPLIMALMAF
jgi:uncharacterized protein YdiU (UPF0061 family)